MRFSTACISSNFGYGGDPNDVSRLRVSKNKWYNFDALFRRDENCLQLFACWRIL